MDDTNEGRDKRLGVFGVVEDVLDKLLFKIDFKGRYCLFPAERTNINSLLRFCELR